MALRANLILLAVIGTLHGELLPVRTYTTADGLASDHIDCIFADSRGLLWFCTPEGLSRFDGYRFVNYGAPDEGLRPTAVSTLVETRAGDLLLGTASGLRRIGAGGSVQFSAHALEEGTKNRVVSMREARSGGLWVATTRELFQWAGPGSVRPIPLRPGPILIQCVLEDGRGGVWVGTSSGLLALQPGGGTQTFASDTGMPGDWVNALLLDSRGRVWAGIRGGLAQFSSDAQGHGRLEKVYTAQSGLAGDGVNALAEASNGTLWIGTGAGVSILKLAAPGKPVFQNLTRAQGLVARTITALAEDQAGNMWVGTEGAGVMRIDRGGFTTYGEVDGLQSDAVFSVFADRAGQVLALTAVPRDKAFSRSVDIFDGVRFHSVHPGTLAEKPGWGWNQVMLQSRTGEWWAATDRGLCRFAPVKAAELDLRAPLKCYSEGPIFRIFEDSHGGVWASAQSNPIEKGDRLMRWNPETNSLVEFPAPRIPGEPVDDLVSAFAEDRQGNIWMGLYKGGLYRYDRQGFQHFVESDGVPSGTVYALLSAASGLWIGSQRGGLGHVADTQASKPRFETIGAAQGLSSNIINCLADDREGRVYAGTGKGVDRVDPKTGHIRHLSTSNGLARGDLMSAMRDGDGSLWFATNQGLSKLAHEADRPPVVPRILITDLRVGNKDYPVSQLGESRISAVELEPSQNQLQVDFAGIDYEPGDTLRYSYMLEGADTRWSSPRTQHSITYAALSSGRFRFLVKAVTSEGVESPAPAEIDFTVLPPFWKRWWFQSLALLFGAATIYTAHRTRVTQMVQMERMRTAIATDLHDDIGASLSQIAILSEVARTSGQESREPLERVAALARELVDSMGDIVWSIRAEPRGMESLPGRMREFALDLLGSRGIDFEMRTPLDPEKVPLSLQGRRQIFLMFKECIHNAARHSGCTAVTAELEISAHEVTLFVQDNGIGLNSGEIVPGTAGGTGIAGMRRRAESLGGGIELTSGKGVGCRIAIRVPARRGAFFSGIN